MNIPANAGWQWIKQGFALFRKRSGFFASTFTFYTLLLAVISHVPFLGQIATPFFAPFFSIAFMTACYQIEQTNNVNGDKVRELFGSPSGKRMFILGFIYLAVAFILSIIFITILTQVGGLSIAELKALSQSEKPFTPTEQQTFGMGMAILFTPIIYAIVFMPPLWFAAPLILWRKMGVFQSMFYSFFSVWRSWQAFFIYIFAWIGIGVIIPSMVATVLASLIGNLAMMLLLIATLLLSAVLYCSFYPTYVQIFGRPELP